MDAAGYPHMQGRASSSSSSCRAADYSSACDAEQQQKRQRCQGSSSNNQVGSSTENNSLQASEPELKFDYGENEEEDYYFDDEDDGCYEDDEGSDYELDTADFNQQLADKFDGLDLPPGVEATVPWLLKALTDEPGKVKTMAEIDDEIAKKYNFFKQFDTVEDFSDHQYASKSVGKARKEWAKRIQHDWSLLEKDLPALIYVRVSENRMDLLRAVMIGPQGTPYHDGLFFFDAQFPASYPATPPVVYYHSGGLRLNPNLYACGKVCLSLLGTWHGGHSCEKWNPAQSTMLQVLISIQALVLNEKPYFNEPGYERSANSADGQKRALEYNDTTFQYSCRTMLYSLRRPPQHFEDLVAGHFRERGRAILAACKYYMEGHKVGSRVPEEEEGKEESENGEGSSSSSAARPQHNKSALQTGRSPAFKTNLRVLFEELLMEFNVKGADTAPAITMVPTPMGNFIPISQVREDVASAYRKEAEWQASNMLLPFKKICAQRKVEAEAVLLESDDVAAAISEEIAKFNICKLVLGSSSKNIFRRKRKGSKTATKISECIPSFCTAYVISKGKLSFVRSATSDTTETTKYISSSTVSSPSSRSLSSSAPSEWGDTFGTANVSFHQPSLPLQRDQALATINKLSDRRASPSGSVGSEISYNDESALTSSHSIVSEVQVSSSSSGNSTFKSFQRDNVPDNSDQASVPEIPTNVKHSNDQDDLRLQIERLKVKLQHLHKLHEFAQHESFDATQKLHKLGSQRIEDEIKLKEIELVEDKVRRLVRNQEREEHEAVREAEFKQHSDETEATSGYSDQFKENETGKNIAGRCFDEYSRYTWEEIRASTSSFSADLMIGKGSYGTVYKAKFHHTVAAVKVLNSPEGCGTQQLHQEVEVLRKIRHPHLLMMLGACPEHGCLVYEYMENGSLDDMLQRRNNMPPLTWFDRFRIAWEVATALLFLHSSKPEPIIHRDLKPANILLDRNLVSKIGDVGLSTLLPSIGQYQSTMIKNTAPVGTFCYIDPEYQRTGVLSMKSDVYALGIVILQLLTARSPMGLAHVVETALEESCFVDVLDATAGQWPLNGTQELAILALRCSEMRRKDRPDLNEHVLPTLEKLKDVANKAREAALQGHTLPPSHFICPILQEVMVDPYVASDGYTYDRKAIEMWLSTNDKSPMTNLRLPNKSLIPNHSLRSAIMDWRSKSK